jgi:hypothetical protein
VLHGFLKEADPDRVWSGLRKTLTPDGNILWLCGEHRQVYEVAPLVLETTGTVDRRLLPCGSKAELGTTGSEVETNLEDLEE